MVPIAFLFGQVIVLGDWRFPSSSYLMIWKGALNELPDKAASFCACLIVWFRVKFEK